MNHKNTVMSHTVVPLLQRTWQRSLIKPTVTSSIVYWIAVSKPRVWALWQPPSCFLDETLQLWRTFIAIPLSWICWSVKRQPHRDVQPALTYVLLSVSYRQFVLHSQSWWDYSLWLKGPLTNSGWLLLDQRARLRSLWLHMFVCVWVCVWERERVHVNEALCSPPNTSSPKAVKWTLSHNSQGSALRRGDSGPGWSRHGDGPCGKSILGERGNWGEGAEQGLKEEQINFAVWSRTGSE